MAQRSLIVGGVGGSGTRVVARVLEVAGLRTLDDLNGAHDALLCTALFKRPSVLADIAAEAPFEDEWRILEDVLHGFQPLSRGQVDLLSRLAAEPRPQHSRAWLEERVTRAIEEARSGSRYGPWFVKEPNLHWVAPAALRIRDSLRFVMVVRHGADMAFSKNQNQAVVWGPTALGAASTSHGARAALRLRQVRARAGRRRVPTGITPSRSLRYWRFVHERVARLRELHPTRVLLVSYDQLCSSPHDVLPDLIAFAGSPRSEKLTNEAIGLVDAPDSIGRRYTEDLSDLHPADVSWADDFMAAIEGRGKWPASTLLIDPTM